MTEKEMLEIAIHCLGVQAEQKVCEDCPVYHIGHSTCKEVAECATQALKEIIQYREIGTIEKFRKAKDYKCQHGSMFIIDIDFAKYLFCKNILVFELFDNGDECIVTDLDDMIEHSARGGLFGIEKDDLDDII